ncbi:MAG TPA: hypothetical protein VGF60_15175 [Xanthobacteraceae bacterium]|jgi:hypothetical protein
MVDIYPKLTPAKLRRGARRTSEGKGIAPLPGVRTDAKLAAIADPGDPRSPYYGSNHHDPTGYAKNRELAERIGAALSELKPADEHGPRFLVAWRIYPNEEHPSWRRTDVHFCGCGCGCFSHGAGKPYGKKAGRSRARRRG